MKKMLLSICTIAALGLASCGEKLLTQEQFDAEVAKGVEAGKAAIISEVAADCDAKFEERVTAEVDRMKQEAEAAKAAEPAGN